MPRKSLAEILPAGQSPYFGMFQAGVNGYTIEECTTHCTAYGIPLRSKDIQAWQDGAFKSQAQQRAFEEQLRESRRRPGSHLNPTNKIGTVLAPTNTYSSLVSSQQINYEFEDLQIYPEDWEPPVKRFFPCTEDNRPMMRWGWTYKTNPNLLSREQASKLSPVGWIGQNMLYQRFIVVDIDGVGHGGIDEEVINFGNQFKNLTLTMEDPNKIGSFHLYFATDRIVPVKHYPWAKLDLMGNAVNAAVYFKNKKPNGQRALRLTKEIWDAIMAYQKSRKEK